MTEREIESTIEAMVSTPETVWWPDALEAIAGALAILMRERRFRRDDK